MPVNYGDDYDRALRYGASESDLDILLKSLDGRDRRGYFHLDADYTKRGVIADALQDNGRDKEAKLMRSQHPVWIDNGRVVGGYGDHLTEGYAALFSDPEFNPLCKRCCNILVLRNPNRPIFSTDIHWEGPPIPCHRCGGDIPSAYGDPEGDYNDYTGEER